MQSKVIEVGGQSVTVHSRDGKNWSKNADELPALEKAADSVEPESPYWDIPGNKTVATAEEYDAV